MHDYNVIDRNLTYIKKNGEGKKIACLSQRAFYEVKLNVMNLIM